MVTVCPGFVLVTVAVTVIGFPLGLVVPDGRAGVEMAAGSVLVGSTAALPADRLAVRGPEFDEEVDEEVDAEVDDVAVQAANSTVSSPTAKATPRSRRTLAPDIPARAVTRSARRSSPQLRTDPHRP